MPRLFTGLEIPAEIGQTLSNLRGGLPGARWIDPENYHVTLRFIGDIDGVAANEIASMLFRVNRKQFDVAVQGLASFGGRKPRAVVASVVPSRPTWGWRLSAEIRAGTISQRWLKLLPARRGLECHRSQPRILLDGPDRADQLVDVDAVLHRHSRHLALLLNSGLAAGTSGSHTGYDAKGWPTYCIFGSMQ